MSGNTELGNFHQLMEQTFFSGVNLLFPGTPIYTPNAKWIEPANQPYFAFYVMEGETFNANIGRRKVERTPIVLHISVYVPIETNERPALNMADSLKSLFANKNFKVDFFQNVNFRAGSVKSTPDPNSEKFRVIAKVPGHRDVNIQY